MSEKTHILILGGGILGSATAWHLAQAGAEEVTVLDPDLAGTYSSSELNAGGARATWWQGINMELARDSLRFYRKIAAEIQFVPKGYLFLYPRSKWVVALSKQKEYEAKGIPVNYLETADLKARLPEFPNLKGVAGATHSPEDGLLDPHLLREFYRVGAKAKGVKFLDRHFFTAVEVHGDRVDAVETRHWKEKILPEAVLHTLLTEHRLSGDHWRPRKWRPQIVINCTGAWMGPTSSRYGRSAPVRALRRQIALFESHEEDFSDRGMIVDSSGLYFHAEGREGGRILAGYSNRDEAAGFRFHYDGDRFFDRKIWLRLYRRGGRRHFGALKHLRGWAGLYGVGPDQTALLGPVSGLSNLFELGAATGRGVMQSFALGRAMAERVLHGRFLSLDATPLDPIRFERGDLLPERLDI